MIPLIINFSDEKYYDGVDLYPEDFYNKLEKSKVLPKTSMINPERYRKTFAELIKKEDKVLSISIS